MAQVTLARTVAVLVLTLAGPVARAAECENVCTETTSCGFKCTENGSWTSCGQFGVCKPPTPNPCASWTETSREEIGRWVSLSCTGPSCSASYWSSVEISEQNQCGDSRTRCANFRLAVAGGTTSDSYQYFCDLFGGCWGRFC